ncbi:FAD-dependent oxidoreductase [Conchiformibius steedae DSM 2580]|uniref:FAD-dependent oxidoreductase n=1 Tax=Conchiformibius steedae DSM 2580 TaxID=1121352 RepID=A0AAE9KZJ2_9NEIS|nr:FAD-dependent oxidoreductase [Conchiformibius steedae]QMT34315.1 FAD-dependent oxidoreductase [Conchiformibius steedae]URD67089.1 FAD-dependent oxidoreductase [Conchiformibius steedae DSM 2580]
MTVRFSRRRFLGAGAVLAGASFAASCTKYRPFDAAAQPPYYPPALLGLRGDHDGSQDGAHAVALSGKRFTLPEKASENYDLVVIGAGISGLTAAYLYRKAKPDAKVLVLDNHDDFGGHAKRNEFTVNGKTLITYGGSESLDSPKTTFSQNAHALLKELGVDYTKFHQYYQQDLYRKQWGLQKGIFFRNAAFGKDTVVAGELNEQAAAAMVARFPLPEADRHALTELYVRPKDYWQGKSRKQKQYLAEKTSYYSFLRDTVKLPEHAMRYLTNISSEYWGHAINAVSVAEAAENGYPGTQKLGLPLEKGEKEPYIYHFPDGNASIARLLVRKLIPAVAAGNSMEDIVTAKFDYAQLDMSEHPVRIRLNSTVLMAENRANGVDVAYLSHGSDALTRVRATHCIFAGHSTLAARILPQMPEAQQQAMKSNVKVPMVYAKIALKNARAFQKLGVYSLYAPDAPYCLIQLDDPVNIGTYRHAATPDEPIVLHAARIATAFEGNDARSMYRGGRARLAGQKLEDLEKELREQLRGLYQLAGESFDDAAVAITFNRWSHGYSYEQVGLWDNNDAASKTVAQMQRRLGNILMAGTDVAWKPYLQDAVEQAYRAVREALS